MANQKDIDEAIASAQRHFEQEGKATGLGLEDFLRPRIMGLCGFNADTCEHIMRTLTLQELAIAA